MLDMFTKIPVKDLFDLLTDITITLMDDFNFEYSDEFYAVMGF